MEEEEEDSAQEEKKYSVTAEARGKTPHFNIYSSYKTLVCALFGLSQESP